MTRNVFVLVQVIDNIELIKEMNPKSIEDLLPLVEVDTLKLKSFTRHVNKEQSQVHPIYFFSEKLKVRNLLTNGR